MEQYSKTIVKPFGETKCIGPMLHGTYIGEKAHLKGKTTLIRQHQSRPDWVGAQFDDRETGYGYGWWAFLKNEFEIDPARCGRIMTTGDCDYCCGNSDCEICS